MTEQQHPITDGTVPTIEDETEMVFIRPDYQSLYSNLARKITVIYTGLLAKNKDIQMAYKAIRDAMQLIEEVEKLQTTAQLIATESEDDS